jgi:hypothetical protein
MSTQTTCPTISNSTTYKLRQLRNRGGIRILDTDIGLPGRLIYGSPPGAILSIAPLPSSANIVFTITGNPTAQDPVHPGVHAGTEGTVSFKVLIQLVGLVKF